MPSKSNKKKAAAERSARLAADSGAEAPAPEAVAAPAVAPAVTAPAPGPAARASEVKPLTAQVAALSVTTPTTPCSGPKKLTSYTLPNKLEPLQKNKPLRVITNSYVMQIKPITCYRFDVSVQGQQDDEPLFELAGQRGGNRNRQADMSEVVAAAFKKEGLGNFLYLYDGAATLYTTKKFEDKKNGAVGSIHTTIDASFSENIRRSIFDRGTRGRFHVVIEPNSAQPTLLTTDILNESLNSTSCPLTQMMQIAVGEYAKQNGFLVTDGGKELFNKAEARSKDGIDEMLGVGASVKIAVGDSGKGAAHVIVDYKKKNFFTAGPLANLKIDWNDYPKAGQFVKGMSLGTTYSRQTIEAIGVSNIPMVKVTYPGGSVLATAAEMLGKRESEFNKSWPAIQTRVGSRVMSFAIETLRVLPNQKLNPKQGNPPRAERAHTRFDLTDRVGKMAYILSPNPILAEFGVNIINTPITTEAVAIALPRILYNNFSTAPNISNQAKWDAPNCDRSCRGGSFIIRASVAKMLLLFNSHSQNDQNKLDDLKTSLERTSRDLGVSIKEIRIENLAQTYGDMSIEDALEAKYKSLQKTLTYVIYADYSQQPTHQLLKLLERLYEVPTQHVTFDKALLKPGRSTMTNFLLKINSKSLGLNHKVAADPMIEHLWGDKSNTLFISYDVCHSSGKVYKKGEACLEPSCVGFGYNGTAVPEAFIGDFHYQLPRHEQVDADLLTLRAKMMTNTYIANRKKVPQNVIILRDGVSEGQNAMVRLEEYPAIRAGVMQAVEAQKKPGVQVNDPKFAILIVLKNNAHRFYLKDAKGIINVPPLTVADQVIVKKNGVEMIMVCHHPLNGTAQPVLINMLLNDGIFKKNDEVARLMATMCCAHQVSTTITSVPEPITVADDYAKRGADLFTVLNKKYPGEVPREQDDDGFMQINFLELTIKLSYFGSVFKLRRVA